MSIIKRATGSNDTPLSDSLSRGLIIAALQGLVSFAAVRVDWLTVDDLVFLMPTLTIVGTIAWGIWDRWGRPRLPSA